LFRPDPRLTHVPATREQVVAVIESINQPQISIPGKQPQAVQAHIVGLRQQNGTFAIYVGLFLRQTGESVIYAHERPEIPLEAFREVEAEGLHFLESMGFMLDNVNYTKLAPEAQAQTLQRIPLLHPQRPAAPPAAADVRASPRQALARLLAGF
jgi:uncharacterized iron-regulated membrane protein